MSSSSTLVLLFYEYLEQFYRSVASNVKPICELEIENCPLDMYADVPFNLESECFLVKLIDVVVVMYSYQPINPLQQIIFVHTFETVRTI